VSLPTPPIPASATPTDAGQPSPDQRVTAQPATALTLSEVRERLARGEGNAMPSDTGRSFWRIMQANLFTLFNLIVGGSFALLLVHHRLPIERLRLPKAHRG